MDPVQATSQVVLHDVLRHPIFSFVLVSEVARHLEFCRCASAMCCKISWIILVVLVLRAALFGSLI